MMDGMVEDNVFFAVRLLDPTSLQHKVASSDGRK